MEFMNLNTDTDQRTAGRFQTKTAAAVLLGLLVLIFAAVGIPGAEASASAKWPAEPDFSRMQYAGKLQADLSNASEGYILASLNAATKHKMKLRIVKGGTTLTYDMNLNADFEVFPLQLGSGYYEISLFENVSGKKYALAGTLALNVSLTSENIPFYYPNQYVDYTIFSEAVAKADELCAGKSELEIYQILCNFMQSNFLYDFVKAITVKAGTLPDIDGSYAKKMGVCQDLSAILCCMLRTQGLPARLIIGYADKQYHAWTVTEIGGKDYFFDPTAALSAIANVKDYSVERYY